ncbi:MAG: hypothetical protein ABIW84_06270, partial [Ilumatobacteraceae bacterium]
MGYDYNDGDDSPERMWIEDPLALLTDFTLIPRAKMSLEQKMNVITRIVIIVWILLLVVKYRHATVFFLATILVIVILYYSRKRHEIRIQNLLARLDRGQDRHAVRSENPDSSASVFANSGRDFAGDFTRFEAKGANPMPNTFVEKNRDEQKPSAEYAQLKAALKQKKILKRQEKLQKQESKMRKKNQQQEEMVRAAQPPKRDPRRPWPPTVPFSMEVHSGHGEISQEAAHIPDPHHKKPDQHFSNKNQEPRKNAKQPELKHNGHVFEGKRDVKTSNRLDEERQLNLRRAQLGGPRALADSKFHGYQTETFQDEEVEDESELEEEIEEAKPVVTKRTFLPANYDVAQEKTKPVKNDNPKMTRHGAARARRQPKWNDNNEIK